MSWFDQAKEQYRKWSGDPQQIKETSDKIKLEKQKPIPETQEDQRKFLTKRILDNDQLFELCQEYQKSQVRLVKEEEYDIFYPRPGFFASSKKIAQFYKENNYQIDFTNEKNFDELKQKFLRDKFDYRDKQINQQKQNIQVQEIIDQIPAGVINIAVIGFHHQKGSIVQYLYPEDFGTNFGFDKATGEQIKDNLTFFGMPDAIHNQEQDFIFFNFKVKNESGREVMVFGVSYFQQISVTEEMKLLDQDLTRNQMQKAITVLSTQPLLGHITTILMPTTKAFFNQKDFTDYEIIQSAFLNISKVIDESHQQLNLSEIFSGTSPQTLIYNFQEKILMLVKAILLEQRVVVYSLNSSSCSNFILSLLSLLPGMLQFKCDSLSIRVHSGHMEDLALPLRIFNSSNKKLALYFTIYELDDLDQVDSFLIGTTNLLIRNHQQTNPDIIVDVDKKQIQFLNQETEKQLKLTTSEKQITQYLWQTIDKHITPDEKNWGNLDFGSEDTTWEGSNQWLRKEFFLYFRHLLCQSALFLHNLDILTQQIKQTIEFETTVSTDANGEPIEGGEIINSKSSTQSGGGGLLSQSYQKFAHHDSQTLVSLGFNQENQSMKEHREALLRNFKSLEEYGGKFIKGWFSTDNFTYWLKSYDPEIYSLCEDNFSREFNNSVWFLENGDIYLGTIRNGRCFGSGTLVEIEHRRVFVGQWEDDKRSGEGMVTSISGDYHYKGSFLDDQKHGKGNLIMNNVRYYGHFESDQYNGEGTLTDSENNIYEGEFKEGKQYGMGKLTFVNKDFYIGNFENDIYDGQGQLVKSNGEVYSGQYQLGKKHGFGCEQRSDQEGEIYQGEFYEDLRHGQGNLKLQDGRIVQGKFLNNQLFSDNQTIVLYQDGRVYCGQLNDLYEPHGPGMMISETGQKQQGLFMEGLFSQEMKVLQENERKEVVPILPLADGFQDSNKQEKLVKKEEEQKESKAAQPPLYEEQSNNYFKFDNNGQQKNKKQQNIKEQTELIELGSPNTFKIGEDDKNTKSALDDLYNTERQVSPFKNEDADGDKQYFKDV